MPLRICDYFPSPYFKGIDFEDAEPRVLVIKSVTEEEVGKEKQKRGVVRFRDESKGLVLNKVNWRTVEKVYRATENWSGKAIELYGASVEFSGEMQPGIRCRIPKGSSADILAIKKPPASPPIDDDIPF